MRYLRAVWEDFKAWRRGEHRTKPRNTRGRVYSKPTGATGGAAQVNAETTFRVKARVIRADGRPDEYYDL